MNWLASIVQMNIAQKINQVIFFVGVLFAKEIIKPMMEYALLKSKKKIE